VEQRQQGGSLELGSLPEAKRIRRPNAGEAGIACQLERAK
jgi:hypothetical protein